MKRITGLFLLIAMVCCLTVGCSQPVSEAVTIATTAATAETTHSHILCFLYKAKVSVFRPQCNKNCHSEPLGDSVVSKVISLS